MEENKRPEPSNTRLYKIANENESEAARKKRIGRIEKDVKDRMDIVQQYTGANQFPSLIPAIIEQKAFIRILEVKGIATENEYEDVYHMLIDERISKMEEEKEEMRLKVIEAKAKTISRGIHLPPGFKKGPVDA